MVATKFDVPKEKIINENKTSKRNSFGKIS